MFTFGLKCVTFHAESCHLGGLGLPFRHPWVLYDFGTLGTLRENHGSSRKDSGWSRIGFLAIFERLSDVILRAFWAPKLKNRFGFIRTCVQDTYYTDLWREFPTLGGFKNSCSYWRYCQQSPFLGNHCLMISGSFFAVFRRLWEQFFHFQIAALETGLKMDGFSW